mmetsp:Transcript_48895/g.129234  ORF Transcript_48895/g.129234 Transcript_48895/m.129234 type:complete len:210 (-) Transcript_48895:32-661(-)
MLGFPSAHSLNSCIFRSRTKSAVMCAGGAATEAVISSFRSSICPSRGSTKPMPPKGAPGCRSRRRMAMLSSARCPSPTWRAATPPTCSWIGPCAARSFSSWMMFRGREGSTFPGSASSSPCPPSNESADVELVSRAEFCTVSSATSAAPWCSIVGVRSPPALSQLHDWLRHPSFHSSTSILFATVKEDMFRQAFRKAAAKSAGQSIANI